MQRLQRTPMKWMVYVLAAYGFAMMTINAAYALGVRVFLGIPLK